MSEYKIVAKPGVGEFVDKKSRIFIFNDLHLSKESRIFEP